VTSRLVTLLSDLTFISFIVAISSRYLA